MKITAIEAQFHAVALPRHFHGSNYTYTHKKIMTISVHTDAGVEGYGYLGDDFGIGAEAVRLIRSEIAPALVGKEVLPVEARWQDMRPFARGILGDRRVALHAQALIDVGLWDVAGKAQGEPLARMFGGGRTECAVIAIGGYYAPGKSVQDLVEEARELERLGCGGMKLKVGGYSVADDLERVGAVRDALGADFLLAVDANQSWSLEEALCFVETAGGLDLLWIEEPVHWDNDLEDLVRLREKTDIPVCAGQSEWTVAGAKRLIEAGAIDVCNIHVGYCGGVTPWLETAAIARSHGVAMANTGEPQLSAHLMPALVHGSPIEVYHPDRDPVFSALCGVMQNVNAGSVVAPQEPGWGIKEGVQTLF